MIGVAKAQSIADRCDQLALEAAQLSAQLHGEGPFPGSTRVHQSLRGARAELDRAAGALRDVEKVLRDWQQRAQNPG